MIVRFRTGQAWFHDKHEQNESRQKSSAQERGSKIEFVAKTDTAECAWKGTLDSPEKGNLQSYGASDIQPEVGPTFGDAAPNSNG